MQDDIELSRRKVLAGLGTIGAASAGVGMGTSAYFNDTESFTNNSLVAGALDMKVAYSAHYSDWSPDEGEGVEVTMWDGPAGTTGGPADVPEGMTGLPTNAAWLIAVDDPDQFLENTQYAADGSTDCAEGTDIDDLEQPVIDLDDVKPGDFGEVTFDFALCDNPGYLWFRGDLLEAAENGLTEPESKDDDEEEGVVELLDVVQAAVWVDDGNNYQNGDEAPMVVGSLRDVFAELGSGQGLALEGDIPAEEGGGVGRNCFSAGASHSIAFAWWVPTDHGNEIQTDSASFELGFYTEQCRHNDGAGLGTEDGETTASVVFSDQESDGASVVVDEAVLPEGGYVVIHASDDGSPGEVLGHSSFLPSGTSTDVTVDLDSPISESQELIAMAHTDDGDEEYEFPDADGPYTTDGAPVIDGAQITVAD